jgi:hypothetical protein
MKALAATFGGGGITGGSALAFAAKDKEKPNSAKENVLEITMLHPFREP